MLIRGGADNSYVTRQREHDEKMSLLKGLENWQKALVIMLVILLIIAVVGSILTILQLIDAVERACREGDPISCRDRHLYRLSAATSLIFILTALMQTIFTVSTYSRK
jgi:hypothetical protein